MTLRALPLALILALVLSMVGGPHRLSAAPAQQVVLCLDGESREIWVDASGAPVDMGHDTCPLCLMPVAMAVPGGTLPRDAVALTEADWPLGAAGTALPRTMAGPGARGPPVRV